MNVSLTPHLEHFVQRKVESGLYGSASEVVREALRLLQQRDQEQEAALHTLKTDLEKGRIPSASGRAKAFDAAAAAEIKSEARTRRSKRLRKGA